MSTDAEEGQLLNVAMHSSKILTDDQMSSLTSAIRDVLSLEVEEEEDVSDIIEYAIAMIQNGKSVAYCTDELNGMGLLSSETIKNIGKILNDFLTSQTEGKVAKSSSGTIGNSDADGTSRMAEIKSSSKENALTMSGALSSARPGLKKERKQQLQQDREHQLRKRLGKRGGQGKDAKKMEAGSDGVQSDKAVAAEANNKEGIHKQNKNNRKRSLASEAFNRLAKKNPKNENIGRQKPQQPQKLQQQQQQWRFEVNYQEEPEADSSLKNKQLKQSPPMRRRNEVIHQKRNVPTQQDTSSSISQHGNRHGTTNSGKKKRLMPPPITNESTKPDDKEAKYSNIKVTEREEEQEFIPAIPLHNATSSNSNTQQLYEGPPFYNHRGRRGVGPGRGFHPVTTPAPTHWHTGLTYVRGAAETTAAGDGGVAAFHDDGGLHQQGTLTPTVVHSFRGGRGGRFYGYPHSSAIPLVYEDVSKKIEQKKWVRPKATAEEKTTET
jgi:hypothetical protein